MIRFYIDHNVLRAITDGLRIRKLNVLTSFEDGTSDYSDSQLFDRAIELDRIIFSMDDDFLKEAHKRLKEGRHFPGVIYAHQLKITIGACIKDLELIANIADKNELKHTILFLPL